jgi:hypothetical protein
VLNYKEKLEVERMESCSFVVLILPWYNSLAMWIKDWTENQELDLWCKIPFSN